MTREQAQQIANKAMVEAGIPCTDAASKIADILMESAKPKVPFKDGDTVLALWTNGEAARWQWGGYQLDIQYLAPEAVIQACIDYWEAME